MTPTAGLVVVALDLLLAGGLFAAVALDLVELEDRRVVDQAVDGGHGHARIGEHVVPAGERLVGGDEDAAPLVALGDQFEQHAGLGLVLSDIREVVQNEQVVAVELGQCLRQLQALAGGLQALHQLAGAHVQHPVAGVDQRVADAATDMALAHAGRTEDTVA